MRAAGIACTVAAAAAIAVGCGSSPATGTTRTAGAKAPSGAAAAGPRCGSARPGSKRIGHVVWIVMENKAYGQVVGSGDAPYINRLAGQCGLATNFRAEAHPSLPNYIAMTSGSTQGVRDDAGPGAHPLAAPSLFSQLGGGWRALEESMPGRCSRSDSGRYAVRHNPATYFTNVRGACARQDVPLGRRPDVSARFTFITPNLCDDMHDCGVKTGDAWLAKWMPRIFSTREYRSGTTAVFLTWDEDDFGATNRIATLVMSPSIRKGARSRARLSHYSMLRTTQEILGLRPYLGGAAHAASMRRAFGL